MAKISLCSVSNWGRSQDGVFAGDGKRICLAVGNRAEGKALKMQVQLLNP